MNESLVYKEKNQAVRPVWEELEIGAARCEDNTQSFHCKQWGTGSSGLIWEAVEPNAYSQNVILENAMTQPWIEGILLPLYRARAN